MSVKYNVVSKGEIVSGFTCDVVKQNIESLLNLKSAQVERICSGEPIVLKGDVNLEFAQKIQKALFDKGLKVHIVALETTPVVPSSLSEAVNNVPAMLYDVVSKGEVLAGYSCNLVKQAIGQLLKLNSTQVDRICSGDSVVLKGGVDLDFAQKIQKALFGRGLKVHIVEKEKVNNSEVATSHDPQQNANSSLSSKSLDNKTNSAKNLKNKAPVFPKASGKVELSLAGDHGDLSAGQSTHNDQVFDQLMANAPTFELVRNEGQEGSQS